MNKRFGALLLGCGLLNVTARADQSVLPVLSSNAGPYQEAFEGFKEEMGESFPEQLIDQGLSIPKDTKIVVAFGGKAALQAYPDRVVLVYAVAPGLRLDRSSGVIKIMGLPAPALVLERIKQLQPNLRAMAVFWNSDAGARYMPDLLTEGKKAQVRILSNQVANSEMLPDALRAVKGHVDALWLWPDPAVVTPGNFATLREFARSNQIPFFAPTAALVAAGATASVSISFREQGRMAARVVRQILSGGTPPEIIYSETEEVVLSRDGMALAGLRVPDANSDSRIKLLP